MPTIESPFFSVIIPAYNRAGCIRTAVDSVLSQAYGNFELIVVDDGSTDDTAAVVSAINDQRLRLMSQENCGVSAARNAGIAVAVGEWVTFLDSDDEALLDWLAELACCINAYENLGVVYCGHEVRYVGETPPRQDTVLPVDRGVGDNAAPTLFASGTFAVRREVIRAIGGYVEQLGYAENTELLWRIDDYCQQHGLAMQCVDLPLTIYNRPPFNHRACSPAYYEKILHSAEYLLSHHQVRFKLKPSMRGLYQAIAGVNAARLGRFREARRWFCRNLAMKPYSLTNLLRYLVACCPWLARCVWLRGSV